MGNNTGSAGPHAVTSAGGVTYSYDANGNNTSSSDGRSIGYTTFDKADLIEKGNHKVEFSYGPDRSRYKRVDTDTSTGNVTTTLYIGSVEKISKSDGARQIKRYIGGYAVITENYNSGGTLTGTDNHYLLKDHLGSTSLVTDGNGAILQQMDFDPWGQRRDPDSWASLSLADLQNHFFHNLATTGQPYTTRGFTGHEMVDEVGIIHMNGRIYDPQLGRFLQADPFVQDPTNTQSLNRYSYVLNNPLNAIDPSGYFIGTLFKKAFRAILRAVSEIIGADNVSKLIHLFSGFCGPLAPLCSAYGHYNLAQANGASSSDARKIAMLGGTKSLVSPSSFGASSGSNSDYIIYNFGSDSGGGMPGKGENGGSSDWLSARIDKSLEKKLESIENTEDKSTVVNTVGTTLSNQDAGKFANGAGQGQAFLEAVGAKTRGEEKNYAITDSERQLVADGKIKEFWDSRLDKGDPVARAGLASLNPPGGAVDYLFGGTSINNRLQAFANVYADGALNMDQIRVELANAHIDAVSADKVGIPGLLNPEQIAEYHHTVFERHSLPPTAFGGTPFSGAVREANYTRPFWCGGCDT